MVHILLPMDRKKGKSPLLLIVTLYRWKAHVDEMIFACLWINLIRNSIVDPIPIYNCGLTVYLDQSDINSLSWFPAAAPAPLLSAHHRSRDVDKFLMINAIVIIIINTISPSLSRMAHTPGQHHRQLVFSSIHAVVDNARRWKSGPDLLCCYNEESKRNIIISFRCRYAITFVLNPVPAGHGGDGVASCDIVDCIRWI